MNKVAVLIDNCKHCPCAVRKISKSLPKCAMYCQTETSLIMLRYGWGDRFIPDWCPRLEANQNTEE